MATAVKLCASFVILLGLLGTVPGWSDDRPLELGRAPADLPRDTLLISPVAGLTTVWHIAPGVAALPLGTRVQFLRARHPNVTVDWHGAREIARDARWSLAEAAFDQTGRHEVRVTYALPSGHVLERSAVFHVVDMAPGEFRVTPIRPQPEMESDDPGRLSIERGHPLRLSVETDPIGFAPLLEWHVDGVPRLELGEEVALRFDEAGRHRVAAGPPGHTREIVVEALAVEGDDDPLTLGGAPPEQLFRSSALARLSLDPGDSTCASGVDLELTSRGLTPVRLRRATPPPYNKGQLLRPELYDLALGAFTRELGFVFLRQRPDLVSSGRIETLATESGEIARARSRLDLHFEVELPDLGLALRTGPEAIRLDAGVNPLVVPLRGNPAALPLATPFEPVGYGAVTLRDADGTDAGWLCWTSYTLDEPVAPKSTTGYDEDWFESTGQTTITLSSSIFASLLDPLGFDSKQFEEITVDVELSSEGLQAAEVLLDPAPYMPGQVVNTEMVRLELAGISAEAGLVIVRERQELASEGQVVVFETDADGNLVLGEAHFELFLEIELPELGRTFHTGMETVSVSAGTITGLPPIGSPYMHDEEDEQDLLFDAFTFEPVGTLVSGNHWPHWVVYCDCIVDLDIDSDNTNGVGPPDRSSFEEFIEEFPPGKYIALNDDDDDGGQIRDLLEEPIRFNPPEDEPVFMVMELWDNAPPGHWRLTYTPLVEVYDMDQFPPQIIPSGVTFPVPLVPNPKFVKVEGVLVSTFLGDVDLWLEYDCDGDQQFDVSDHVKATVIKVDLDVDSDNTTTTPDFAPQRDANEDNIEDHVDKPGRFVPVNNDDDDNDGVADYGDGFDLDATANNVDDVNAKEDDFVRMVLEVPAPIDLTVATIRFTYSASDPAAATTDKKTPPTITPAAGNLRIWKKKGTDARDKREIDQSGDWVASAKIYAAANFGLTSQNRTVDLWLEGVAPSVATSDRILVEVDPDGNAGPAIFVPKDAVRVTVFGIEILDAAKNAADHVQHGRWESAFAGTAASRSVKNGFEDLDAERFYVRVTDSAGGAGPLTATIESYKKGDNPNTATAEDQINSFQLTAAANAYDSGACVLVVNKDNVDDNFAQVPDVDGTDDGADDPTMFGLVDGKLKATYTRAGATATAVTDVCDKRPQDETKTKTLRAHVLKNGGAAVVANSEVDEDIGQMNNGWSQCCLQLSRSGAIAVIDPPAAEAFMDVGYDHDGNPATPVVGAGDGTFNFTDTDTDLLHDNGEASEPFTDGNGNSGYDFGVDLTNGLDEYLTSGPRALVPTREERHLIDSFGDNNAKTIEYFVVNTLSAGSRGEAFNVSTAAMANNLKTSNVVILRASAVGLNGNVARAFITAAHETGHVMLDDLSHTSRLTLAGRVNMMVGGGTDAADAVINSKRLTNAQCTTARGF